MSLEISKIVPYSVALFKKKFTDPNQCIPDVAEDKFVITVFKKHELVKPANIELVSATEHHLADSNV